MPIFVATIVGTPADDLIVGTDGRDVIAAGDGDDVVRALGGNDLVCGDDGDDVLLGGPGNDKSWARTEPTGFSPQQAMISWTASPAVTG